MSANDLLSQDEIDALLHGVEGGDVETDSDEGLQAGEARSYADPAVLVTLPPRDRI